MDGLMDANVIETTVELDVNKLEKIMRLGGFTCMEEAIEWALSEAMRIAVMTEFEVEPWPPAEYREQEAAKYEVRAFQQHYACTTDRGRKRVQ